MIDTGCGMDNETKKSIGHISANLGIKKEFQKIHGKLFKKMLNFGNYYYFLTLKGIGFGLTFS